MSENSQVSSNLNIKLKEIFPILTWMPEYRLGFLKSDLVAGITLAFFMMPTSLAYATLAGLPPQYGVYSCLVGGFVFALFTSSKQMVIGPTSAISLMIASIVGVMAAGSIDKWIAIAGLTAFVVGVICLLAFIFNLNSVVNFISENILLGFKTGAAFSIASTQFPKLFGITLDTSGNFFIVMERVIGHLNQMHLPTFLFGLMGFLVLYLGAKFFPGKPVSLVVLVISILVMTYTAMAEVGIKITGEIPSGLPSLGRPSIRMTDVEGVLSLAFACFLLGYIETISAARTFALKNNYKIDTRQELLSMGMANLGSSFSSGYVIAGGLSQTLVNDKAGAKTPLSLIISSIILAILLFFTDMLANLPQVILAAIVLDAILGLIKIKEIKKLYFLSKTEFAVSIVAFIGVLVFGVLKGVLIAAIVSIILLLRKAAYPKVSFLGRVENADLYSDTERHPENQVYDGLLIVRVQASLLYFNVDFVNDQIWLKIQKSKTPVKMLILNMNSSPFVDVSGSYFILQLQKELTEKKIHLKIVESRSEVRDILRKQGIEKLIGPLERDESCHDAVQQFLKENSDDIKVSY